MQQSADLLVDLDGLRLTGSWRSGAFDDWADLEIAIDAFPFSGTLRAVVTRSDLSDFRDALGSFEVPSRLVLGGGRAVYLALDIVEDESHRLSIEVSASPSEDDPWPMLRFLVFGVDPAFATKSLEAVNQFLLKKEPS